jgi:hypothetical protein
MDFVFWEFCGIFWSEGLQSLSGYVFGTEVNYEFEI